MDDQQLTVCSGKKCWTTSLRLHVLVWVSYENNENKNDYLLFYWLVSRRRHIGYIGKNTLVT